MVRLLAQVKPSNSNFEIRRMRIAYLFNTPFFMGGGEISLKELIRTVSGSAIDPVIVAPGNGPVAQWCRCRKLPVDIVQMPALRTAIRLDPLKAVLRLYRVLKRRQIHLIHANGSRACFYGIAAGMAAGVPLLWHVRETIRDYYLYDFFLAANAKGIITVSHSVAEKRFGHFPTRIRKKISVVHNGVDCFRFRKNPHDRLEKRLQLGLAKENVVFGVIAHIRPVKGHSFFLKAFGKFRARHPELDAKAILVGRMADQTYGKFLRNQVRDDGIEQDIIFLDHTEDIETIYAALDILVVPSKREGFSRVVLEGMACELPIVGTDLDEIREALAPAGGGILVAYGDTEALAAAFFELARAPEQRHQMGKRNRRIVKSNFSLSAQNSKVKRVYHSIRYDRSSDLSFVKKWMAR